MRRHTQVPEIFFTVDGLVERHMGTLSRSQYAEYFVFRKGTLGDSLGSGRLTEGRSPYGDGRLLSPVKA